MYKFIITVTYLFSNCTFFGISLDFRRLGLRVGVELCGMWRIQQNIYLDYLPLNYVRDWTVHNEDSRTEVGRVVSVMTASQPDKRVSCVDTTVRGRASPGERSISETCFSPSVLLTLSFRKNFPLNKYKHISYVFRVCWQRHRNNLLTLQAWYLFREIGHRPLQLRKQTLTVVATCYYYQYHAGGGKLLQVIWNQEIKATIIPTFLLT